MRCGTSAPAAPRGSAVTVTRRRYPGRGARPRPHRQVRQEALGAATVTWIAPAERSESGAPCLLASPVRTTSGRAAPSPFGDVSAGRQHLTRMELIGERVDHGHRRDRRHGVQPLLAKVHERWHRRSRTTPLRCPCRVSSRQLGTAARRANGMPPSCAMPTRRRSRVRVGSWLEDDRHPARPLRGRRLTGSFFSSAASSSTSRPVRPGTESSSRRNA